MTLSNLVDKFRELELRISQEKGPFSLFALFLREDVPDRWDLMVAAPWVGSDKSVAVEYLVKAITAQMGAEDLTNLSRIVVVDPNDGAVQALNRALSVEHGAAEIKDSSFFGLPVKHAFIITSTRPVAA